MRDVESQRRIIHNLRSRALGYKQWADRLVVQRASDATELLMRTSHLRHSRQRLRPCDQRALLLRDAPQLQRPRAILLVAQDRQMLAQ